MKIGDKIRMLREHKNITRKELASYMSMTVSAIELIENNKNKSINMDRLEQFAQFFEVPITDFFENNSYHQTNNDNSNGYINQNTGPTIYIQESQEIKEVLENVMNTLKKLLDNLNK